MAQVKCICCQSGIDDSQLKSLVKKGTDIDGVPYETTYLEGNCPKCGVKFSITDEDLFWLADPT